MSFERVLGGAHEVALHTGVERLAFLPAHLANSQQEELPRRQAEMQPAIHQCVCLPTAKAVESDVEKISNRYRIDTESPPSHIGTRNSLCIHTKYDPNTNDHYQKCIDLAPTVVSESIRKSTSDRYA